MPITRSLVVAMIAVAAIVPAAGGAGAADAGSSGWWRKSPVAFAPDAQGALVVQGGPQADQPVSYAAVTFTVSTSESVSRLTLSVASGSASTSSTLTVCPLTGSFAPADGGSIADAPPYDCTTTASATVSGGQYSFDVSSLVVDGRLALAVLPATASDRVALTKPGGDALQTTRDDAAVADSGASSGDTQSASGASGGTGFEVSPLPSPTFDAPALPATPALPVRAATPAIGRVTPRSVNAGVAAPIVFVLLALVTAALWLAAGRTGYELADIDAEAAGISHR